MSEVLVSWISWCVDLVLAGCTRSFGRRIPVMEELTSVFAIVREGIWTGVIRCLISVVNIAVPLPFPIHIADFHRVSISSFKSSSIDILLSLRQQGSLWSLVEQFVLGLARRAQSLPMLCGGLTHPRHLLIDWHFLHHWMIMIIVFVRCFIVSCRWSLGCGAFIIAWINARIVRR